MKLSITDHEATILKQALSQNIMAEGILKKINSAEEIQEEIKTCKHEYGHYKGKKECCVKCGCLGIGMGEEWILNNER